MVGAAYTLIIGANWSLRSGGATGLVFGENPWWGLARICLSLPGAWQFIVAMTAGSLALVVLARETVSRDWRLRMNRQLMAWSLGGVALLIFGAGATQLGTNLYAERVIELNPVGQPQTCFVERVELVGNHGVAMVDLSSEGDDPRSASLNGRRQVESIDLDQSSCLNGGQVVNYPHFEGRSWVWMPEIPDRIYALGTINLPHKPNDLDHSWRGRNILLVYDLHGQLIKELPLPPDVANCPYEYLFQDHARLYCYPYTGYGGNDGTIHQQPMPLVTIALGDPDHAWVERVMTGPWPNLNPQYFADGSLSIRLPPIPGWSPRQRLEAWLKSVSDSCWSWQLNPCSPRATCL